MNTLGSVQRKPKKTVPSKIIRLDYEGQTVQPLGVWLGYVIQVIRGGLLALMISVIAGFAGFLTIRLFQLTPPLTSLKGAADEILRRPMPTIQQVIAVLSVCFVFAIIFYAGRFFDRANKEGQPGQFTYLLAGISLVVGLDLILMNLTLHELWMGQYQRITGFEETISAQCAALLVIILFIPIFSGLIRIKSYPVFHVPALPHRLRSILHWLRFLLVSSALIWVCTFFATQDMWGVERQAVTRYLPPVFAIPVSIGQAGALMTATSVAALFFWPTRSRAMRPLWLIRILIFVVSIATTLLLYNQTPVGETYLLVVVYSAFSAILAFPLCRVFG